MIYTDSVVVALLCLLWHTADVWGRLIHVITMVISVSNLQTSHEWSWSNIVSSAAAHVPAWHETWRHQNSSWFQVSNVDRSLVIAVLFWLHVQLMELLNQNQMKLLCQRKPFHKEKCPVCRFSSICVFFRVEHNWVLHLSYWLSVMDKSCKKVVKLNYFFN